MKKTLVYLLIICIVFSNAGCSLPGGGSGAGGIPISVVDELDGGGAEDGDTDAEGGTGAEDGEAGNSGDVGAGGADAVGSGGDSSGGGSGDGEGISGAVDGDIGANSEDTDSSSGGTDANSGDTGDLNDGDTKLIVGSAGGATAGDEKPEPKIVTSEYIRTNPAKINDKVIIDRLDEKVNAYKIELTLMEVRRGGGALKFIKNVDRYVGAPEKAGREYLLAKFRVSVLESKEDIPVDISYMFNIFKSNGSMYDDAYSYPAGVEKLTSLFQGATQEGYLCFIIDKNDVEPLIVIFPAEKSQVCFSGAATAGAEDAGYNPYGDPDKPGNENNPAGLGVTVNYNTIDLPVYDAIELNVTMTELYRGKQAKVLIDDLGSGMLSDPGEGKEYLVAKFSLEAAAARESNEISLYDNDFYLKNSNKSKTFDSEFSKSLNDDYHLSELRVGSTLERYIVFTVDIKDAEPYIVLFNYEDASAWFTTVEKGVSATGAGTNAGEGAGAGEGATSGNDAADTYIEAWALGCSAILASSNYYEPSQFGMFSKSAANANRAKALLSDSWNVKSREDLLGTIERMVDGGHNVSFADMYSTISGLSSSELKEIIDAQSEETAELMINSTLDIGDKWGDKQIKAWDWYRMIHLAGWGYVAGYLDKREAYEQMTPVVERLKRTFTSWEEANDNYMDGFIWWSRTDLTDLSSEYYRRMRFYDTIKDDAALYDPSVWD